MQSRTTYSLVTWLLLTAAACAHQLPGDVMGDSGGAATDISSGGTSSKAGTSNLPLSGTTSTGTAGKSTGGSTALPPAGSGGKTSNGGGGKGGKGGTGGSVVGAAGQDPGPVNMPIVGLSVTFMPDSKADPVDFLGGELDVINDTAQPLTLTDLKIRYYFTDEITAATPSVMMNWARFGATSNLGNATCTGQIVKLPTPKPGADSYIELSCSASSGTELTAGTMLKISWKAGAPGQGKFIQADDWSFADPSKIVVLNGNTIVWGIEP
jgi:endoglucanase